MRKKVNFWPKIGRLPGATVSSGLDQISYKNELRSFGLEAPHLKLRQRPYWGEFYERPLKLRQIFLILGYCQFWLGQRAVVASGWIDSVTSCFSTKTFKTFLKSAARQYLFCYHFRFQSWWFKNFRQIKSCLSLFWIFLLIKTEKLSVLIRKNWIYSSTENFVTIVKFSWEHFFSNFQNYHICSFHPENQQH